MRGVWGSLPLPPFFIAHLLNNYNIANLRLVCVNDKPTESWQVWESTRKASH